jgi:hypothetical protein
LKLKTNVVIVDLIATDPSKMLERFCNLDSLENQIINFTNALEDIGAVKEAIKEKYRLKKEEIEAAAARYEVLVAVAHETWRAADPFGWPGSVVSHMFGKDIESDDEDDNVVEGM